MKLKNTLVVLSLFLFLSLTGCSYLPQGKQVALDTVTVVSKASVLKGQYEIVSQIIERHKNDFSKDELQEFAYIDQNARTVYQKIKDVIDLENFDISPEEIKYLYEASRDSYVRAKAIIQKHEEQFTPYEITQLRMFDVQLQEMDKAVKKLLQNPDTMDTRKTLLTIIQVASLSLKVILPLVI